ncbi:MAG: sensor histidine kinase [Candidatus Baltobacteraceae bacterium]
MTVRSRLAAFYALVIFAALLIFAFAAVVAIDRTLRSSMDARLSGEARAASAVVDIQNGRIVADPDDRRQFLTLTSTGDNALVLDSSGNVRLSSASKPPPEMLALPSHREAYYSTGKGQREARAFVMPLARDARRVATVITWRDSDWIDETDRGAAFAFAAVSLVISLLAVLAGSAVTRRALEDAFSRQRRFTADASHELRAPLAVIRAEADLALRGDRRRSEYRTALQTIADEADRIESLIGDLLLAVRAQGRARVQHIDLLALARDVAARLAPTATAKAARLEVLGNHAIVNAERESLERAVLAIAHNAVSYAPHGGRITFLVTALGSAAELTVSDNGPGFSSEALEHADERFWRDETGRSRAGSGLGLAIAKAIVESCGGTMTLANAAGAEVKLRFPAI